MKPKKELLWGLWVGVSLLEGIYRDVLMKVLWGLISGFRALGFRVW